MHIPRGSYKPWHIIACYDDWCLWCIRYFMNIITPDRNIVHLYFKMCFMMNGVWGFYVCYWINSKTIKWHVVFHNLANCSVVCMIFNSVWDILLLSPMYRLSNLWLKFIGLIGLSSRFFKSFELLCTKVTFLLVFEVG